MKIAYQHLLRFLKEKPSIENLSDKLFQLGHEHEIENFIFDMEFTPNRGDCLSLLGLARDLNVFYDTDLDLTQYKEEIPLLDLSFINQESSKCPEISFLNIEINGKISNYKDYLNDYFIDLKLNKNNFFTDVSNYVAYEMGQPTHSYDFSLINGDIVLKKNINHSKFKTLLGENIDLNDSDLVFTSNGEIINLAGIVGGESSACSKNTTNALVECAYFKPESIIGKAIKYDLHSDASHKFERGVDPICHKAVLRRFIQIVSEHVEIIKLELYESSSEKFKDICLALDINRVNKILGTKISLQEYTHNLTKLGFKIDEAEIKVPSFRSDITHQNDLAEEIARVIGYNNIQPKKISLPQLQNNDKLPCEDKIKFYLINNGFFEVINSTFSGSNNSNSIEVDNPLDTNRQYVRTGLTESLIDNLTYNERRQRDSIRVFEISDIYTLDSNNSLKKEKKIALIVPGRKGHNFKDFSSKLDQKYLITLFKNININIEKSIVPINRDKLHSKIKTPIFSIEVPLDEISKNLDFNNYSSLITTDFVQYESISEYPSSYRDFSFSIKDPLMIKNVITILEKYNDEHLKDSFLFDFYENKKSNETKIGYRFIFQSHVKTLTDKEIDKSANKIIQSVLSIKSVSIPGML